MKIYEHETQPGIHVIEDMLGINLKGTLSEIEDLESKLTDILWEIARYRKGKKAGDKE